jgi:hypothetical protein
MAITINGRSQLRSYEEVGYNLQALKNSLDYHKHYLKNVSESSYRMYKDLTSDFNEGWIPLGTIQMYLRQFKDFFEQYPDFDFPDFHVKEIKEAIKKHCK